MRCYVENNGSNAPIEILWETVKDIIITVAEEICEFSRIHRNKMQTKQQTDKIKVKNQKCKMYLNNKKKETCERYK